MREQKVVVSDEQ